MQKAQIQSEIEKIDTEILLTKNSIDTATVQQFGAISDFTILTIHKNTMRAHIKKLEGNKVILNEKLETLIAEIIELQKETEQFAYLLDEEKEAIKKLLLAEQEASEEYIQSKYISG